MPSDILYPDISEASGLVMEEQERREEADRWRERQEREEGERATLPVKRSWAQPQGKFVTTKAIMEGARNLSSSDGATLNGLLPTDRDSGMPMGTDTPDPDDKPPKLVVNLAQSDKASQVPEQLPEVEHSPEKCDEADGQEHEEPSCIVDCLFYTLQCCDCVIM